MAKKEPWEVWEEDVQQRFGLDATICSGNKWHDVGDAVDNSHPSESGTRLLVDCKHTTKKSYSLNWAKMQEWWTKGFELGKMALLAIRFHDGGEYAVLDMGDFEELLEKAQAYDKQAAKENPYRDSGKSQVDTPGCPNAGNPCNCTGACMPKYGQQFQGPSFNGWK